MTRHRQGIAVVIEDDEVIRALIRDVLERQGFTVLTAANGADGVAAVRDSLATVVTMDLRMPVMSGIEAITRIREFSDAFILVLSGRASETDENESISAGADAYMTKPFRPRELSAVVKGRQSRGRVCQA